MTPEQRAAEELAGPHPAVRYRPHSTLQGGQEVSGGWYATLAAAVREAIGWRELPLGASYGFWVEASDGQTYRCCESCRGLGECTNCLNTGVTGGA